MNTDQMNECHILVASDGLNDFLRQFSLLNEYMLVVEELGSLKNYRQNGTTTQEGHGYNHLPLKTVLTLLAPGRGWVESIAQKISPIIPPETPM